MKNIQYTNKELGIAFIYLLLNLTIYFFGTEEVKNFIQQINVVGTGFIGTFVIIYIIEDLNETFIKKGYIKEDLKVEKTDFKKYMLLYGLTSFLLFIGEGI